MVNIFNDLWFDHYGQCYLGASEEDREALEKQDLYPHLDMVIVERTDALRELMEKEGYGPRARDNKQIGKHHNE